MYCSKAAQCCSPTIDWGTTAGCKAVQCVRDVFLVVQCVVMLSGDTLVVSDV